MLEKIINKPRRQGKTSDAVQYALTNGVTLVVADNRRKDYVLNVLIHTLFRDFNTALQARSRLNIITYAELQRTGYTSRRKVIVDDFNDFISYTFRGNIDIVAFTETLAFETVIKVFTYKKVTSLNGLIFSKDTVLPTTLDYDTLSHTYGFFIVQTNEDEQVILIRQYGSELAQLREFNFLKTEYKHLITFCTDELFSFQASVKVDEVKMEIEQNLPSEEILKLRQENQVLRKVVQIKKRNRIFRKQISRNPKNAE